GTRTMALIFGGVVFLALGGAILWADSPAPGRLIRPAPADPTDRIIIEVVEQGDAVKLIVHRSRLAKLVGVNGPGLPIIGGPPTPVPQPAPTPRGIAPGGVNPEAAPVEPKKIIKD